LLERISEKEGAIATGERALALGKLAERLSPEEAADLCGRALKPILELMKTVTTPFYLPPALAQLAPHLRAEDAAAALGSVLARMENPKTDRQTLDALAPALGKLAPRLPQEAIVSAAQRAATLPPWKPELQALVQEWRASWAGDPLCAGAGGAGRAPAPRGSR
jgi:hypothetical protein